MHYYGVLISEEPITNYSSLEMPPKGFPIVQFNMYTVEEMSLETFNILSQRSLTPISDTVKLVKESRGIDIDIGETSLSKNEARYKEFLSSGKTIDCFYIESPAMRGLLLRLKCNNYKVLVAASSIILLFYGFSRPIVADLSLLLNSIQV